jgi:ATP-binding cassette subfamily B protein
MGGGPMIHGEKAKDFKGTMKKLIRRLAGYRVTMILVIGLAILSAAFSIIGPKQMGSIVDEVFTGLMGKFSGGAGIDFTNVAWLLLGLLGLYAVSSVFAFLQGYLMAGVTAKLSYTLRRELSNKIHHLPMSHFDGVTHGEILSHITNDVDTLTQSLNQSLSQVITSITTVIGVLIMMISISWQMTLAALLIVPISAVLMSLVVKKSQRHFRRQQEYLGHVNGQVEEVYGGQLIVKAFNGEERALEAFEENNKELYHSAWKSQFLSGLMFPIMGFIGNLGYVVVAILGGTLAVGGIITVGDIQSFIQYVRMFNQPLAQIAQVTNMLQSTAAAAERVFAFLALEEESPTVQNPTPATGLSGQVTFDHVQFGYQPDKTVIHDFSAVIKPGQKVAIVGPTGAGKTTMVKLLMRFYDVTGGRILVDGHDIRSFDRNELRGLFGMVLQDTWLFGGSILNNIRYGRLDATEEEVIEAARSAHAHHFIQTLPGGYQMELNEEASNVSQGQKQLLTIARAILADPQILILDEATSSVDTRTEIRIQKAMDNLMHDRTSFIIAHRLSTIRDADLILVMRDGDIVEQGKHEELLEKGGFYAQLYNAQFQNALSA